ncbi:substrate-binding periplasmic protein [Peterkaempfera sp. SMS 1(5)a]|uniref:substrate-binding periplasmic protein n=1 Tax=Peterkaempfera podocarpi TaxID=3232308 RepID=UPI00366E80DD
MAKRLGVKVVYKQTTVPAALAGLTSGQYDYAAVSLSQTPERARNVLFSTPLTWGQNITMVRKESSAHTLADFAGKRVGVATGSSQADYAAENLKQSKIIDFNNDNTALSQLINGSLDGYVMGLSQASITMQQHPGLLRIATSALQPNPAGVAFRKGNKAFYDAYEKELAALVSDGTFLKLYNRYFTTIPYRSEMVRYWPQLKAQLAAQS